MSAWMPAVTLAVKNVAVGPAVGDRLHVLPDLLQRLTAIAKRLPAGCAFCGPTAAVIIGGIDPRANEKRCIEVVTPPRVGVWPRPGLRVRTGRLECGDITEVDGLPVTTPVRTTFDLARHLPILEAVAGVDAMLRGRLLTTADLASYVAVRPRVKGAPQARRVVELADTGAESPMESMLRAMLVLAGLPRPESQVQLGDADGVFIGRVDLYYREQRLVIEYDGQGHRDTLVSDLRRQNDLLRAGFRLLRFSHADLAHRPQSVVTRVAQVLGIRRYRRRGASDS
jgi:very-short-patch-repair endonuclease